MAVYVDNAYMRYGRMMMCHMMADTHLELLKMAEEIGVEVRHIQSQGTWKEHLDVCRAKCPDLDFPFWDGWRR